jgi:hypothetical protein
MLDHIILSGEDWYSSGNALPSGKRQELMTPDGIESD